MVECGTYGIRNEGNSRSISAVRRTYSIYSTAAVMNSGSRASLTQSQLHKRSRSCLPKSLPRKTWQLIVPTTLWIIGYTEQGVSSITAQVKILAIYDGRTNHQLFGKMWYPLPSRWKLSSSDPGSWEADAQSRHCGALARSQFPRSPFHHANWNRAWCRLAWTSKNQVSWQEIQ